MPRQTAQRISLDYDEMLGASPSGLTELEIAKLIPFPGHPFKLYTRERLEKMTESIREHGVLEPVLVWLKHELEQSTDTYVILSGHNRVNVSKLVGLTRVPVRIMENLSETEAALIVTETNLHQRSFADLAHNERAVAIHAHYEAVKAQGQNACLVEAIERMCGVPMGNGRSIEKTCEEFALSQGSIARYLRIYLLIPELRELLDTGKIPLRAGQELSWLDADQQQAVYSVLTEIGKKITEHQAKQLRERADTLDESEIREILCGGTAEGSKPYSLTIPRTVITQYFPEKTKKKEIAATVEKALAIEDGKKLIVKTFEVPSGTSPKELVEQSLQRNGTRYEVRDILKKELEPVPESKTASKTITLDVDTDDEEKLLKKLSPVLEYDEGGYTGQLALDEDSLEAEVTESQGYAYTVKDTQQVYGVNRNDPYYVPRTVSKNGATLQLANVNWSPMGERYDVNSIPHLYNATATYTGKAYGSKPTAFEATATYTGQVSRLAPGNVLYTLVYEPAGTVPLTAAQQAAEKAKETDEAIDWTVFAWIGGGLLVLAAAGGGVFLLVKSGVFKRRPKKPRPPKPPKAPKAPRRPTPPAEDAYDDFDDYDTAYADTEMPDRRRMRIPEAMRQMERPEMGGEAT